MHVGTLSSFNSRPGWAGLVWPVFFFSSSALGRGNQGTEGGSKGLQSSGTDRQMEGAPPVRLRYGHTVYNKRGRRRMTDGWMIKLTDLANAKPQESKPTNHYVHIVNGRVCC